MLSRTRIFFARLAQPGVIALMLAIGLALSLAGNGILLWKVFTDKNVLESTAQTLVDKMDALLEDDSTIVIRQTKDRIIIEEGRSDSSPTPQPTTYIIVPRSPAPSPSPTPSSSPSPSPGLLCSLLPCE